MGDNRPAIRREPSIRACICAVCIIACITVVSDFWTFLSRRDGVEVTAFGAGLFLIAGGSAGGHGRDAGGGACCSDGGGSSLKASGSCCGSVVTGRRGGFETGGGGSRGGNA